MIFVLVPSLFVFVERISSMNYRNMIREPFFFYFHFVFLVCYSYYARTHTCRHKDSLTYTAVPTPGAGADPVSLPSHGMSR